MKKQIKEKSLSCIIIIIFSVLSLAINNSCKKEASTEIEKMATATGTTIIYTDINPDTTLTGVFPHTIIYNLDLNNDGIIDFVVSRDASYTLCGSYEFRSVQTTVKLSITPTNGNDAILNDGNSYAYALASTAPIVPDSLWANTSQILLQGWNASGRGCFPRPPTGGHWSNVSDRYLGLKFIKGSNTYYGWARLSSSYTLPTSNTQFKSGLLTIKDYAYNSKPNQPILAGQIK